MTVTAAVDGLADVQTWAADLVTTFTQAAASEVLAESEATANRVESVMPVDTGWAAGRWADAAVAGGVWDVSDDGLTIEQGSDLTDIGMYEYITRLNEGSSKQAPAGFIDVEAERAGDNLEARLNEIADMVE